MQDEAASDRPRGGINPAALAAATVAAVAIVIGSASPYNNGGTVIGVTVLPIILGIDSECARERSDERLVQSLFNSPSISAALVSPEVVSSFARLPGWTTVWTLPIGIRR